MKLNFEIKFNKYILFPLLFLILAMMGYLYITPYLAILGFKSAVESRDTEEARKYIDFISVRKSLKDQLSEILTKRISKKLENQPLGMFKLVLISPMVNSLVNSTVDATVTPNGLKLLLDKGKLSKKGIQRKENRPLNYPQKSNEKSKITLYYKSFNRFILRTDIQDIDEAMKAYWKRDMLFNWKLTSIELPFELMTNFEQ